MSFAIVEKSGISRRRAVIFRKELGMLRSFVIYKISKTDGFVDKFKKNL